MIMIPVDEADAFDRLSIWDVKQSSAAGVNVQAITALCKVMEAQLTTERFDEITTSPEYEAVIEANRVTFEWVERAKNNLCSAQDVDRANHGRYLAKKALQEKFFPKSPLTETKTERPY